MSQVDNNYSIFHPNWVCWQRNYFVLRTLPQFQNLKSFDDSYVNITSIYPCYCAMQTMLHSGYNVLLWNSQNLKQWVGMLLSSHLSCFIA